MPQEQDTALEYLDIGKFRMFRRGTLNLSKYVEFRTAEFDNALQGRGERWGDPAVVRCVSCGLRPREHRKLSSLSLVC
jgi:hypothetical protein